MDTMIDESLRNERVKRRTSAFLNYRFMSLRSSCILPVLINSLSKWDA